MRCLRASNGDPEAAYARVCEIQVWRRQQGCSEESTISDIHSPPVMFAGACGKDAKPPQSSKALDLPRAAQAFSGFQLVFP